MSVITKDLGIASAYGYAKSKGYTGTEEEFAELMASYADVAQQAEAAAQDAEDAKDEAVTAKTDAQTAKTAAQAAQSAAETASGTASAKASEAAQSAQSAAGSASAAQISATAASGSAQTAQTAAQTATTKASEASSSASAASTAKTGAETARTGAQTAQTAAETAQANAEAAASSVSASAAQIEQNTEEIGAIKNDLSELGDKVGEGIYKTAGTISNTINNGAVTGTVGQQVEVGTQTTWKYMAVSCSGGDAFRVKTYMASNTAVTGYVYFVDANGIILDVQMKPTGTQEYVESIVTAPSGTATMYAKLYVYGSAEMKVTSLTLETLTDAVQKAEAEAYSAYVVETATGSIASFTDGADDVPVKDLIVAIEPVQDLHGQSAPYPAGGGVNTIDSSKFVSYGTAYGLTTSFDGDWVIISGTYTGSDTSANFRVLTMSDGSEFPAPANMKCFPDSASASHFTVGSLGRADGNKTLTIYIVNMVIDTAYNLRFRIIGYEGSTAPDSYSPYSNICPISGWTGANVTACGVNIFNPDTSTYETLDLTGQGTYRYGHAYPSGTYTIIYTGTNDYFFYRVPTKDLSNRGTTVNITPNSTTTVTVDANHMLWVFTQSTDNPASDLMVALGTETVFKAYQGETYEVDWTTEAGTVYGGTLDVATGVLTVDRAYLTNAQLVASTWTEAGRGIYVAPSSYILPNNDNSAYVNPLLLATALPTKSQNAIYTDAFTQMGIAQWWSNRFAIGFADASISTTTAFKTKLAENGSDVVYPLATPQTYQLTPEEVSTVLGQNNIFADCGDSTVQYRADTKLYIDKVLNA